MSTQLSIWKDEKPMVKVHHPIIFAQLGYMDVTAMRLFLLMLAKWNVDAPLEEVIKINFAELIPNYSGNGGVQYEVICKSVEELKGKIKDIKLEEVIHGERRFRVMSVLDYLELGEKKEHIEGRFALKIRDYLKQIKGHFTHAELREIFSFRSYYAIRLYLIGKSFYAGMKEVEMTVDEFKLMLIGDLESYKEFKVLKRDLIKPTLNTLSKTSGAIRIEEKKKDKKTVTSLIIRPLTSIEVKPVEESPFSEKLMKYFEHYDVNKDKAVEMLRSGEVKEEGYFIYVFERIIETKPNVKKIGGIIHKAIASKKWLNDYKPSYMPPPAKIIEGQWEHISLEEAKDRFEKAKAKGAKFTFSGFAHNLKTNCVLIRGYNY